MAVCNSGLPSARLHSAAAAPIPRQHLSCRYCAENEYVVTIFPKGAPEKGADVKALKNSKKLLYGVQATMQPHNPHSSITAVEAGVLWVRTCSSHGIWRSLQQPHQWRNAVRAQHGGLVAIIAAT